MLCRRLEKRWWRWWWRYHNSHTQEVAQQAENDKLTGAGWHTPKPCSHFPFSVFFSLPSSFDDVLNVLNRPLEWLMFKKSVEAGTRTIHIPQ